MEARPVVMSTTGQGGKSIYALDVTDLSDPSEDNILWEFSNKNDSGLGLNPNQHMIVRQIYCNRHGYVDGVNQVTALAYIYILRND